MTELNQSIGFTDSLTNNKEIRIYRTSGMNNHTGIFRMYQDSSEKWRAEFIDHYSKVQNQAELKIEKRKLKTKSKMDLVWLEIQKTNIQKADPSRFGVLILPTIHHINLVGKWRI